MFDPKMKMKLSRKELQIHKSSRFDVLLLLQFENQLDCSIEIVGIFRR
jgi:hypothetical protein